VPYKKNTTDERESETGHIDLTLSYPGEFYINRIRQSEPGSSYYVSVTLSSYSSSNLKDGISIELMSNNSKHFMKYFKQGKITVV
jgi:hypothetical protein